MAAEEVAVEEEDDADGAGGAAEEEEPVPFALVLVLAPALAFAFPARRAAIAALLAATRALMSSRLYEGGFSSRARLASRSPGAGPSARRDIARKY
jgi:hypothetical protein